ncbi:hypothetical protein GCM10023191_071280 [Actinoallomurus oryzae]|uniref:NERD domain-containing protein n=2 Tax=Thermomonosporaceae TaxID=2012 RepID=A0ABP8QTZ2_9ACTN
MPSIEQGVSEMAPVERDTSTQTSTREQDDASQRSEGQDPFERERPKQETYGDMIGDPQVQRWIRRSVGALALGLLFALLVNLPVGLLVAIAVVVADVVLKNRKESSVEAWRKPSVAERKTERQLRGMEKAGYRTLHARAVPRDDEGVSDGQIDHLVIGPTGVYAVDSEKWDKRLPVRAMSHRKLFLGPFNKKERLDEARWESEQASKLISEQLGKEVPVQPSLAIYGPAISWKVLMVRDVDVYAGTRARNYLRRRPKILSSADINDIYEAAERVLPPKYPTED